MNKENVCIHCWWVSKIVRTQAIDSFNELVYQCRSNSPTRTKAGFPLVKHDEWCKKFIPRVCQACYGKKERFVNTAIVNGCLREVNKYEKCGCNSIKKENEERFYLPIFDEYEPLN